MEKLNEIIKDGRALLNARLSEEKEKKKNIIDFLADKTILINSIPVFTSSIIQSADIYKSTKTLYSKIIKYLGGNDMSKLIDELKKEHSLILDTLFKVNVLDVISKEGQDKLFETKSVLLAHLKKEDEKLYPVLRKAAEKDENLKRTLDIYANDMEGISTSAREFLDKYAEGSSGSELANDFGIISVFLYKRIQSEEEVLFKEYERLNQ